MNLRRQTWKLVLILPIAAIFIGGCKRSESAFDGRTLEKRPHVETVAPEDRKDAFRP
jgi:hypothetical protein